MSVAFWFKLSQFFGGIQKFCMRRAIRIKFRNINDSK